MNKTVFLGVRISFFTGNPNTQFPETHPHTKSENFGSSILKIYFLTIQSFYQQMTLNLTALHEKLVDQK